MAEHQTTKLPPDDSRGPVVLGIIWTQLGLAIVVVALRLYSRLMPSNTIGWDDFTIILAVIVAVVGGIFNTLQVKTGFGRHIFYLSENQIKETVKWTTFAEIQNIVGIYLVKLSVCLLILRMLSKTNKAMLRTLVAFMAFLSVLVVANVLLLSLRCIPLQALWDQTVTGRCIKPEKTVDNVSKAFSTFGVVTDFLCVLLPIFVLRGLQMTPRTKVAIICIFGFGIFTATCSIAKTVLIQFTSKDITWDLVPVEIWASLEQDLAILIASAPAIRRLFVSAIHGTLRSDTYRLSTHTTFRPLWHKQQVQSSERGSDVDHLVHPEGGIKVTNLVEVNSQDRRVEDEEWVKDKGEREAEEEEGWVKGKKGRGFNKPQDWIQIGEAV